MKLDFTVSVFMNLNYFVVRSMNERKKPAMELENRRISFPLNFFNDCNGFLKNK